MTSRATQTSKENPLILSGGFYMAVSLSVNGISDCYGG